MIEHDTGERHRSHLRRVRQRFEAMPRRSRILSLVSLIVGVGIMLGAVSAQSLTALVTVDPSVASDVRPTFTLDDLRPEECKTNNVTVQNVYSGDTTVSGDNLGSLLLADTTTSLLNGGSSPDCIVSNGTAVINGDANLPQVGENIPNASGDVCIGDLTTSMYNCEFIIRH